MGTAVRLVIDDPENFHLLTTDMKEEIIQGAIATVNVQAALTRKNAVKIIQSDFVLRNNFTTSQIQFEQMEKSRLISLSAVKSKVGVTEKADYMARQETGGERKTANGSNLAIPTLRARGGNRGSPVAKELYLTKLKRKTVFVNFDGADPDNRGSRLVSAAHVAYKNNKMLRYNKGLYTVEKFEKKGDNRVSFKMDLIYNFQHRTTFTNENQWLQPASKKPAEDCENIFISQMRKRGM